MLKTVICYFHTENACSEFTCAARFSMLHLTWRFRSLHAPPVATPDLGDTFFSNGVFCAVMNNSVLQEVVLNPLLRR